MEECGLGNGAAARTWEASIGDWALINRGRESWVELRRWALLELDC